VKRLFFYTFFFVQIPLTEHVIRENDGSVSLISQENGGLVVSEEKLKTIPKLPSVQGAKLFQVWSICRKALLKGRSVLVFCESRRGCEVCAKEAWELVRKDPTIKEAVGMNVEPKFMEARVEAEARLARSASGKNDVLCEALKWSVAFHHAGLTEEERRQVETVYRRGGVRLLFATSTLAIGVNLPASAVIQLGFKVGAALINCATYMQMAGRAGRTGQDKKGKAYLVWNSKNKDVENILKAGPLDIHSAILTDASNLPRFVLDVIGRGIVYSLEFLFLYLSKSLAWSSASEAEREGFKSRVEAQVGSLKSEGIDKKKNVTRFLRPKKKVISMCLQMALLF
jgi:replicative superfamily II helicase